MFNWGPATLTKDEIYAKLAEMKERLNEAYQLAEELSQHGGTDFSHTRSAVVHALNSTARWTVERLKLDHDPQPRLSVGGLPHHGTGCTCGDCQMFRNVLYESDMRSWRERNG